MFYIDQLRTPSFSIVGWLKLNVALLLDQLKLA